MEDWEHVTTCKNLMLSSQETHTGHKGFICVGTTHVYGEDITCRGRVRIGFLVVSLVVVCASGYNFCGSALHTVSSGLSV